MDKFTSCLRKPHFGGYGISLGRSGYRTPSEWPT